jgi:hypothetical protein
MARCLRFHPLVADDISAASDWYEGRSVGLGERFRSAVDARFDDVIASPETFPRAFEDTDYRFARIPTFPYLVLFRAQSDAIDVVGLFHRSEEMA